jgi:hypothetical protein
MGCGNNIDQIKTQINAIKNQIGMAPLNVRGQNNSVNIVLFNAKQKLLIQYQQKINDLENHIKTNCVSKNNLSDVISQKQREINRLTNEIKDKEQDLDVAKSRYEAIMDSEKKVSHYQGLSAKFGFTKPFKRTSVSILIALGIFLSLMSFYMASVLFTGPDAANVYTTLNMNSGTFDKKAFLYGVGAVAIIVGILSFIGVYGKSHM